MSNVLIIGGAGYIGSYLVKDITNIGDITVVDKFWFGDNLPDGIEKIKKDAFELDGSDLEKFDCVVFLAGLSNDPMADYSPKENFIENSALPAYLAYMSKKSGVKKFIYASSCSVYGFTNNQLLNEQSLINPQYPYGISKLLGESGVMALKDDSFNVISLRQGTVGGWSPRMRFDLVVNAMTKCAIKEGRIIVNNPNIWRPLIDIRDLTKVYANCITSKNTPSGIYNISGQNITIGSLGEEICNFLQKKGFNVELEVHEVQDARNYKVDTLHAKNNISFNAQYSYLDSVESILKNININKIEFESDCYYNIKTFKKLKSDN